MGKEAEVQPKLEAADAGAFAWPEPTRHVEPSPLLKAIASDAALPVFEAVNKKLLPDAEYVERRRKQAAESAARKRAENPEKYRKQNNKDVANYRKRKKQQAQSQE